jgi:hypothetical protein
MKQELARVEQDTDSERGKVTRRGKEEREKLATEGNSIGIIILALLHIRDRLLRREKSISSRGSVHDGNITL